MHLRRRLPKPYATFVLTLALTILLCGCKTKDCVPGQQVACACPGGTQGVQTCDVDGARYLPCICTAPLPAAAPTPTVAARRQKQIRCGSATCDVACCATFDPSTCARNPDDCPRTDQGEAVIYECDGPEDCAASQACCLVPGKSVIGAVCVPRQECAGAYPHPRYGKLVTPKKVCHANVDCDVSEMCGSAGDSAGILTCNK